MHNFVNTHIHVVSIAGKKSQSLRFFGFLGFGLEHVTLRVNNYLHNILRAKIVFYLSKSKAIYKVLSLIRCYFITFLPFLCPSNVTTFSGLITSETHRAHGRKKVIVPLNLHLPFGNKFVSNFQEISTRQMQKMFKLCKDTRKLLASCVYSLLI